MVKQNQVTEAKPNPKSLHEAKRALVNELADEWSSPVKLPAGPFSADSDGSIEAHATQLGDVRLQDAQRQALAVQIGRVNGNRHLQRVVASLKRNEVGTGYAAPSGTDNTIETTEGKTLLDHELTHVVQQTKNSGPLDASPSLEGEARQAGLDAISGRPVRVSGSAPYGQPQRDVSDWMAEQLYRWDPLRLRTYTVESVLRENDPSKVSQLRRDQIARASVEDRLRLVRLALRALDRESVETIWGTFSRQQLIEVTSASRNMQLWRRCLREGADLDELRPVQELQRDFRRGVKAIAGYYLRQNRDYVVGQMGSLGIPDPTRQRMVRTGLLPIAAPLVHPSAATITAEQAGELQQVQELAVKVHEAQQAQEALRRIPVGYNDVDTGCRMYGEVWTRREVAPFNPNRRPHHPPRGTEDPRMASWDDVKREHDQVQALISGMANRCPAIYALIRDERVGDLAQAGDQAGARRVVGATLASLLNKIDEAQHKLDSDRLDYRELRPIHAQMFGGRGTRPPGTIETDWTQPLPRWVGEEDVRAHERAEFWLALSLGSLAAAAFVIAELATFGGATFFVAAGVGLGLSGAQAARSWDQYLTLAQAAETNVRDELALVSEGQVSAALLGAILDTVFAFLDVYGVGRAARMGMRAAPVVVEALARGAERAAIPATIDVTQAGARELVERAVTELGVEETLRRTGKNLDQLTRFLGDSPIAAHVRAYREAGARLTEAGAEQLDELLRTLSPGAREAEDIVRRALGQYGPRGTLERAGGWKQLASVLGEGSQVGRQLENWRTALYNDLEAYIRGLPGGNEAVRTGRPGFAHDMDISILGPNASEYRDRARSFLASRAGTTPGRVDNLLDAELFSDPRRMHLYDILEPSLREDIAREADTFRLQLIWNRRLHEANRHGNEYLVNHIRRQMRELRIQEVTYTPLAPQDVARLRRDIDTLHQQLNAADRAGDVPRQQQLVRQIGQTQAQIEAVGGGGYFSGGGVRRWVSERPGESIPPLAARRPVLPTEQLGNVLDQLSHLDEAYGGLLEAVARQMRTGRPSARELAKALKDIGKYGGRLRQGVGEALGQNVPRQRLFDQVADTFADFSRRADEGILQRDVASREGQVLVQRAATAMYQLEAASLDILQELHRHAGIERIAGGMGSIQRFTRVNAKYLRARDAVLANLRNEIRHILQTLTRGVAETRGETSESERFPWEQEQTVME